MKQSKIIGMIAYYRPLYNHKILKSKVLSSVALMKMELPNDKEDSMSFKNSGITILTLENGDEVFESECYFELPTETASS